jgi:hypothetical protein
MKITELNGRELLLKAAIGPMAEIMRPDYALARPNQL